MKNRMVSRVAISALSMICVMHPLLADSDSDESLFSGKGVELRSADGAFSFNLGTRIHSDVAIYEADGTELGNGTEVRRARLSWNGTLWNDWGFSGAFELGAGDAEIRSTTLRYTGFKGWRINAGRSKQPFSLERLTSSNYTTFMERASVATGFSPGRAVGLSFDRRADNWLVSAGMYGSGEPDDEATDESYGVTGRFVFAPVNSKRRVVHLGSSIAHNVYDAMDSVRFRARPESHVTDTRLVDTGDITGIDTLSRYAIEFVTVCGPWSFQGEYIAVDIAREGGAADLGFDGWYAFVSWFPTGESRNYTISRGNVRRLKTRHNAGDGGTGAWELALRYSVLDVTDADVIGGEQATVTLGVNWYPTPNVRFMMNYIDVVDLDRPGDPVDGAAPAVLTFRAQVDF